MTRGSLAKAQAWASRLLMSAAMWLLGDQRATWGRAMQAELEAVADEGEALAFACGCGRAAIGHALRAYFARPASVHRAGAWACSVAVLLGCVFMHSAGAPVHYAVMNLLSLALALATFGLVPRFPPGHDDLLRARLSFALGALLLGATLAPAPAAASAWLSLGPVHLNLAWLLLPALLVASEVRPLSTARPWAVGGLLMACAAMAVLGDAVLSGVVAAVLTARAWGHRSGALALLAVAAWGTAMHLWPGWQAPQAVPFVDQVLPGGFAQGWGIGLALALLQVLPLWPALRHRQARPLGFVWGLLVLLSLPGWLPSPLVGFGGSFIVGYLLSLALLPNEAATRAVADPTPASVHPRHGPPNWPRSGLT